MGSQAPLSFFEVELIKIAWPKDTREEMAGSLLRAVRISQSRNNLSCNNLSARSGDPELPPAGEDQWVSAVCPQRVLDFLHSLEATLVVPGNGMLSQCSLSINLVIIVSPVIKYL